MTFRRAFVAAIAISGAILACSGGSGSSTGLGGGGGGAGDATAFLDDFCTSFAPCCSRINRPTDGASCKALYAGLTANQDYDPAKGQACLNEIHARSSATDFCTSPTSGSASCDGVFREKGSTTGTKQAGEDCSKDGDCVSSTEGRVRCASSYGSGGLVIKSCQIQIAGGHEGDTPCLGTKNGSVTSFESSSTSTGDAGPPRPASRGYICDVANGVYCNTKSATCTKIQEVGGACESSSQYQCVTTAYCDFTAKKCVARVGDGGDCSKSSQACTEETRCDSTTRKCVARFPEGATCKTSDECISKRCENLKCAAGSSGSSDLTLQLLCGGSGK